MVLQAPPPDNYDGELDFESKAWASARQQFLERRRGQKKHADTEEALQDFLRQSCSEQDARKYIRDAQKEKPQYAAGLGVIMTKMDAFMKVGDLAIKSAPESIGLAWAGIRLCLHSVQNDFATFSQYNDACSDMIGILINCSVYGDMFGRPFAAKKMEEIHRQVLDRIPLIYADLLDFNYSMRKHTNTNRGIRILVGMYKDTAAKYKDKFDGLKANEQKMRDFANVASQQLSQYYLEMNMQNEADILRKQSDVLASLTGMDEAIRHANRIMEEGFRKQEENFKLLTESSRRQEEYLKDLKKHSPFEKAKRIFEQNEQKLDPSTDRQASALSDTLNREPGTCQWIFDETEYKVWSTSKTNSMLWITAGGGFGKSFLMGSIIETLQKRAKQEDHINVSFFFCKRGDPSTQKIERIKNSIIFQLYQEAKDNSDVLDEANRIVSSLDLSKGSKAASAGAKSETKKTATFVEAYQGLVRLLKKEVFLVVDALDEIGDRGDQPFLEDFRNITEPSDIKVHILFGSRPEGDLKKDLEGIPTFDVKGRNEADIRLNVTTLVGKLSGFSASERQLAIDDIVTKSGGQFRYVKPAMDFLRLPWSRPLATRLEKLQKGLTNSYTQALQLTDPNYHGLLKSCLTWALLGEGQVKVSEVMDAFRCTYGRGEEDEEVEDTAHDKQTLKQVEQAGNTFLDVDWITGVIAPRHETVTEYFLNNPSDDTVASEEEPVGICPICKEKSHERKEARPFVITRKDGHLEMAITILQTLSSPAFWRKHYPDTYWNQYFPEFLEQLSKPKEATAEALDGVDAEENENGDSTGEQDGIDAKDHAKDTNGVTDRAKVESEPDLEPKVNGVGIDEKAPITIGDQSTQNEDGQADIIPESSDSPPITVTVTNADGTDGAVHMEEVKGSDSEHDEPDDVSTADSDINPEEMDSDWTFQPRPAGEIRYEVGHCTYHLRKVEELWRPEERKGPQFDRLYSLMKTFFDNESHNYKKWIQIQTRIPTSNFCWDDGEGLTALTVASACGLTDLMKLLIDAEGVAKPDANEINKALYYAACGGANLLVPFQILLDNGADPKDMSRGLSAFHMLLLQGPSIEVVQLFLDHGADVKQTTEWLWSSLNYLVIAGSDAEIGVLELLIKEHGADPDGRDDDGETPLHNLVRRRDCPLGFLRKFIELGADVNADDKEEQRPLYEVCMEGNVEAARIILESHPDIEKADKNGITALLAAASNGHPKTCQLLLDHGANITALDKRNRSCFFLACGSGNPETALFIASKLEGENEKLLFLKSDAGKTPLTKAAAKGHTEVVKLLLSKIDPAAVNEKDNRLGHTPLHVAAMNGSKDIVELLLENGASTTVTDTKGHTPFKHCCQTWAQSHSRDAGALLLLMDREPIESLQDYELLNTAAVKGNVPVLEKLVQNGVSVHQMDKHGWTPLQIVSQYGHTEAMNFLTEKGAIIGRKPTAWSCDIRWVKISEDGTEVEWLSEGHNLPRQEGRAGVLSNHPIPAGTKRYYYEITITEPGGECTDPIVGLGLCNAPAKTSGWMPGWPNRTAGGAPSWAYHGDDGNLFTDKKGSADIGPGFPHYGHGDTIGCGVDFDKSEMFFTKNGKQMDTAFKDVRGRLHPVVGLGQEVVVKGNWGLDLKNFPFMWEKANVVGGGWTD